VFKPPNATAARMATMASAIMSSKRVNPDGFCRIKEGFFNDTRFSPCLHRCDKDSDKTCLLWFYINNTKIIPHKNSIDSIKFICQSKVWFSNYNLTLEADTLFWQHLRKGEYTTGQHFIY
jgi:hypothetical protein